ncbi:hypothetical protein ACVWYH_009709 [Bradyrhizobium sp. GM24.11]
MRMLVSTKGCTQHINQNRAATTIPVAIRIINRHLHSDHTGVGAVLWRKRHWIRWRGDRVCNVRSM